MDRLNLRFVTSTRLKKKNGKYSLSVEIYSTGRRGTMSPTSYYLKYRGRWICPLAIKRKWSSISAELTLAILKDIYPRETLEKMIFQENPFLKLIKRQTVFKPAYLPIPLSYNGTKI